jgi:predicted transcriptional regulator
MASSSEKLSRREREIMNAIHALADRASTEDIRQQLTDPPSYSAVRAMLAKLEAKGHVRHEAEGLRYVYVPTTSRSTAQKKALHQLMDVFFGGSPASAVTALLKQEKWTAEELDELRSQIDEARANRRKK